MNSKQKGKRGELELAKKLKEYGFSDTHRTVQYNGKADDSKADLCGLPGIHVECKRVEKLNIDSAMGQAIRDHSEGEMPVVFHRKSRSDWMVTMRLEDWMQLYKGKAPEV